VNLQPETSAAPAATDPEQLMLSFARSLTDELAQGTVDLPSWSQVTERARAALASADTSADQIARLLAADANLAVRVLTIANSAMFSRNSKPLTDLRLAVMRIGRDKVRSAVYACALAQLRNAPRLMHLRADLAQLWRESTTVAALARLIATRTECVDPDEAMLAGLLHNIGKLYILARIDRNSVMWRNQRVRDTLLMGWHARIGKAVASNWKLSETIAVAIGDQDVLNARADGALTLGEVLAAAIIANAAPDPLEETAQHLAAFAHFGLDAPAWLQLLQKTREATTAMRNLFGD
jgi:HD-like signal output (HDOD) protein